MEWLYSDVSGATFLLCCAIALVAGVIKGMVGFALPMVLVSGLSSFIAPELALAGLLLPTLASNLWQALRGGWRAAWRAVLGFWRFLLVGYLTLATVAQFVLVLRTELLLAGIGAFVSIFALMQLMGLHFSLKRQTLWSDLAMGLLAGIPGGVAAIWGPPTVMYLTALGTEKRQSLQVQGVVYGLGAVVLVISHIGSGVFNVETAGFSVALLGPVLLGMWIGFKVHDRVDQATFRRATLLVLLVAGANLVRRGLM